MRPTQQPNGVTTSCPHCRNAAVRPDQRPAGFSIVVFGWRPGRWQYSAKGFLKNLIEKAPFRVRTILTDNGKEFTDRFCAHGERKPTGQHPFDQVCTEHQIDHRLIRPKHPQPNGMVERFNARIAEVVGQTKFRSARHLKETLTDYCRIYNQHIPQKNLGHLTPIQALKQWKETNPELFKKSVYNLSGPDKQYYGGLVPCGPAVQKSSGRGAPQGSKGSTQTPGCEMGYSQGSGKRPHGKAA